MTASSLIPLRTDLHGSANDAKDATLKGHFSMSQVSEILSIWRSPLDKTALAQAQVMADSQPRCSISYDEDFSLMTIYNFGHYVDTTSSYDAALYAMLGAMKTPGTGIQQGGLAFIPQQSFPLSASGDEYPFPFQVPYDSVIVGSGGGGIAAAGPTSFFHFTITPTSSATMFLEATGAHNDGGVYFRSLAFQWLGPANVGDVCIHADVWNARVIRCTFLDCPTAVIASGLSAGLEQCTINYTVSSPIGATAVVLSGIECLVLGPGMFSQTSQADGGATGCTGISIQGVEHVVIADMQLYEWTTGIDFSQPTPTGQILATHITNCEILCWQNALKIEAAGTGYTIAGVKVTSCTLAKTSDSTDNDAIVKIDGKESTTFHDINLLDCTVFNMASAPAGQSGLNIVNGSDIKIIGGTYSNNSSNGGAGIAITGSATDIQIIGANLTPNYPGAPHSNNQQYALMLAAGSSPAGVLVSGCDMAGYGTPGPVYVDPTSTPTYLFIVDCAGYNDQNTPLTATSGQLTSGVSASQSSPRYFGPSVISYTSTSPVMLTVFGQTITARMGIIFLPSPYDEFFFDSVPTSFLWTGQ
jgi:hypothetical protein